MSFFACLISCGRLCGFFGLFYKHFDEKFKAVEQMKFGTYLCLLWWPTRIKKLIYGYNWPLAKGHYASVAVFYLGAKDCHSIQTDMEDMEEP